jgi:excinuclease ABC subunit C
LELIERNFLLRKSKRKIEGRRQRPCLNYQIGRCLAPCAGKISKEEYARIVREVTLFLKGKDRELVRELKGKMEAASRSLEFERAATIRDQIQRIERVTEQQKIISTSLEDKDVFGMIREGDAACIALLFVRGGKLLGKKEYFFDHVEDGEEGALLGSMLTQYYGEDRLIPPRIFVSHSVPEEETLAQAFSTLRGRRTRIIMPLRGLNRKLVGMACENATLSLETHLQKKYRELAVLKELQSLTRLKNLPRRIEAFDISNIQGDFPVASMVVFENARPHKVHYRHFRVRSVQGANDYAMMEEVLSRRYRSEEESLPLPDLILVDGGKGQLNVLCQVAKEKRFPEGTGLMALAKARPGEAGREIDRILLPGRKDPLRLKPDDPVVHLLQRVRDESHRFAVTYYRKLHSRETLTSRLQEIPGVGKKRSLSLLKHFGSLQQVRRASLDDLADTPSINREMAVRIYDALHNREAAAR